jgi:hypothetical protein
MIDKRSGNVAYAIMSFGGFLGLGNAYHPLPWSLLKYDTEKDGYVVNLDRRQLEGAPSYQDGNEPDWSNRDYQASLHDYYEVGPYHGGYSNETKLEMAAPNTKQPADPRQRRLP